MFKARRCWGDWIFKPGRRRQKCWWVRSTLVTIIPAHFVLISWRLRRVLK
jgi:hypothetical protein